MTGTEFLGFKFDPLEPGEALARVRAMATQSSFSYVITPNVSHVTTLARAQSADPARDAMTGADLTLCDSSVLALLARCAGQVLPVVTGSGLVATLLSAVEVPSRIAVIGGDSALLEELARKYPRIVWEGFHPGMNLRDDPNGRASIVRFVEASDAGLFLFSFGAPQSEITAWEIARRSRARGVALCSGAALEFAIGAKRRAPRWMQAMALEWLFRLVSEPRRLWRRYLVEGPMVFGEFLRWRRRQRDTVQSKRA